MIKVTKDLNDIPSILNKKNREDAFDENIKSQSYQDTKNLYKAVQNKLQNIYNNKCAYCEDKLLNAPKHIEHYRPKSHYYWLAYSWDNLFLCCSSCNSSKGIKFDTKNEKIIYSNEPFKGIHTLGKSYDNIEEPYLINPEKDNIANKIVFDKQGKISSQDERVTYTIKTCNLNRNELIEKRMRILNTLNYQLKDALLIYKKKKDKDIFVPIINSFISECKTENDFYAFRVFCKNLSQSIISRIQK